jgi:hypothetical protein
VDGVGDGEAQPDLVPCPGEIVDQRRRHPRLGLAADGDEWASTVPRPGDFGGGGERFVGTGEEGVWRGVALRARGREPYGGDGDWGLRARGGGGARVNGDWAIWFGGGRSARGGGALAEGRSRRDGGGKVSMRGGGEVPMRCEGGGRLRPDAKERGARGGRGGEGANARMTKKKTYRRSRAVRGGNYDNISSFLAVGLVGESEEKVRISSKLNEPKLTMFAS